MNALILLLNEIATSSSSPPPNPKNPSQDYSQLNATEQLWNREVQCHIHFTKHRRKTTTSYFKLS